MPIIDPGPPIDRRQKKCTLIGTNGTYSRFWRSSPGSWFHSAFFGGPPREGEIGRHLRNLHRGSDESTTLIGRGDCPGAFITGALPANGRILILGLATPGCHLTAGIGIPAVAYHP